MRAAALCLLLVAVGHAAAEPVIYNPFAARLASFPNDISRDDLDGAEIHKATGADLLGLALAGVTMNFIKLPPCTVFNPHFQPDASELFYVLEGNLTFSIVDAQGTGYTQELGAGDLGTMPLGLVHYLANTRCTPASILNFFTSANYTRIALAPTMTALGGQAATEAFGLPADTAMVPAPLIGKLESCSC